MFCQVKDAHRFKGSLFSNGTDGAITIPVRNVLLFILQPRAAGNSCQVFLNATIQSAKYWL